MKHVLAIACGPCWRPRWHPQGAILSMASPHGGTLVHVDEGGFSFLDRHLQWAPQGDLALAHSRTAPRQVIQWPEAKVVAHLPPGRYCWTHDRMLARATRDRISTLGLGPEGWNESGAIASPAGERWVWVHGLGKGTWAALRWNQAERSAGVSRWRGGQWPVEHFRLPHIDALRPTHWNWSADNESWLLVAHHERTLMGWTFPQGLEWLRKASATRSACLSDQGVFWAEGANVIFLDRVSQEMREWAGVHPITGMAWNPARRCLALTSRKGLDILLA